MAQYFRTLAAHAALNRLAIVDPPEASSASPRQYTYADLLTRVTVFHERLAAEAQNSQVQLHGARIGLMVPPGVDFIAAVLGIWSVKAIVGWATFSTLDTGLPVRANSLPSSPNMPDPSIARNQVYRDRLRSRSDHLSFRLQGQNHTIAAE